MAYDIIGDVHGYASELRALLKKMGYRDSRGAVIPHAQRFSSATSSTGDQPISRLPRLRARRALARRRRASLGLAHAAELIDRCAWCFTYLGFETR